MHGLGDAGAGADVRGDALLATLDLLGTLQDVLGLGPGHHDDAGVVGEQQVAVRDGQPGQLDRSADCLLPQATSGAARNRAAREDREVQLAGLGDIPADPVHHGSGQTSLHPAEGERSAPAGHVDASAVADHDHVPRLRGGDRLGGDVRAGRIARVRLELDRARHPGNRRTVPLLLQLTDSRWETDGIERVADHRAGQPAQPVDQ